MAPRSVRHYGPYTKTIRLKGGKKPSQKGIKNAMGSPKLRKGGAHTETKTKIALGKLRDKRQKKR